MKQALLRNTIWVVGMPTLLLLVGFALASNQSVTQAELILNELELPASASSSDAGSTPHDAIPSPSQIPSTQSSVLSSIVEARRALTRAKELHAINDENRAEIAEEIALEWAQLAREQSNTTRMHDEMKNTLQNIADAQVQVDHTRTLLEHATARRTQLQKTFDALEQEERSRALDAGPKRSK